MRKVFLFLGFLFLSVITPILIAQTSYQVNFTVTTSGYVMIYISGPSSSDTVTLHYGIENGPQQAWTQVFNQQMQWNGHNFSATIGPFPNNTWIGWVFYDNTTGTWINYDNHPFWNWNLQVNPLDVGYTYATVLQNGSILITAIGRAPDNFTIHYGLTTGPQTGLPWSNISNAIMKYNPLYGNYTVLLGPFSPGQWIQWVYFDATTGVYYHASNGANFAIQDVYSPIEFSGANYTRYVFLTNQSIGVTLELNNLEAQQIPVTLSFVFNSYTYNVSEILQAGNNLINVTVPNYLQQGIFYPTLNVYQGSELTRTANLPALYILNVTGKKPLSFVIVWNMHQPLYIGPNGTWEQPWVWLHTGQDFNWNGQLVGSYELQAMLIKQFNVNVTIDFTPVLLYQWETILNEGTPTFSSNFGVNVSHDINATNYTLSLYKQLVQEGKVDVLTVPFYHPLQAIMLNNGWYSDVLAQIQMGRNMTHRVFGVWAKGTWTPEMAFDMGLVTLYNESGISYTILDQQAFLPYSTLVNGTLNPDQPFIVENSIGQRIIVLFRNTTLSNDFSFYFFSQSPSLTAEELIHQLATIYMNNPGGVVTVALDGENPLIFNPTTGPSDLYAIYQSLSEYQGTWLVTQTAQQAIETHKPTSIITNLPESSWDLNLDYWNNGYPGKIYIWGNLSLAREYLVAYTALLGDSISPTVPILFNETPNSTTEINTLWNYLYVAEGSDWTWQTGPPANGPSWFMEQALLYSNTIVSAVKSAFNNITIKSASVDGRNVHVKIYNGLQESITVNVVVQAGPQNYSSLVTLHPGVNNVKIRISRPSLTSNEYKVILYAPVTEAEVGASPIPVSNYGFQITLVEFSATSAIQGGNQSLFVVAIVLMIAAAVLLLIVKYLI
ncbi:glycoside hydrolase [Sulfolobales archaeon HS-7]|nr:glycoside hydrolase [Sulfolobales archaeon HS-7]